ncbi:hypothetical protein [Streptomyces sp. IB2014 016-6]|uniref:hypothetical protein n=1 Tax=Streptomyces sp. IB2014 016-6 TaxID=2517818 RepID=UPI0011C6EF10|nr:hypothetical protein [Streptomyces sp. IB2014 016-6]TXL91596.1 hypothetical protein EW053_04520 [Streptomyces sp. IB2014 016-6]
MRTITTALAAGLLLVALGGCGTESEPDSKPSKNENGLTPEEQASVRADAGMPEEPTGAKRTDLLAAIADVAPEAVKYEDKAIDAAQNQCSAINGGANRLDWLASQRFTYKDVTTTEAQGKQLNKALVDSGFCQV